MTPSPTIAAGGVMDALCDNLRTIDKLIHATSGADLFSRIYPYRQRWRSITAR